MKLDFSKILKGMCCRGTESNCRHQPFQDVILLCKELKLLVIFHCGERGQLNGQPLIFLARDVIRVASDLSFPVGMRSMKLG